MANPLHLDDGRGFPACMPRIGDGGAFTDIARRAGRVALSTFCAPTRAGVTCAKCRALMVPPRKRHLRICVTVGGTKPCSSACPGFALRARRLGGLIELAEKVAG